jgi:hypothetical protein
MTLPFRERVLVEGSPWRTAFSGISEAATVCRRKALRYAVSLGKRRLAHCRLRSKIHSESRMTPAALGDSARGDAFYDRDGGDRQTRGLDVDTTPWQASVFTLTRRSSGA